MTKRLSIRDRWIYYSHTSPIRTRKYFIHKFYRESPRIISVDLVLFIFIGSRNKLTNIDSNFSYFLYYSFHLNYNSEPSWEYFYCKNKIFRVQRESNIFFSTTIVWKVRYKNAYFVTSSSNTGY